MTIFNIIQLHVHVIYIYYIYILLYTDYTYRGMYMYIHMQASRPDGADSIGDVHLSCGGCSRLSRSKSRRLLTL